MRCCQGGLCGLMNNVLRICAKQLGPADDYKGGKRREKKGDSHYQVEMMMVLSAAAWTELRGTKSEVEVTGDKLERC